MTLLNKILGMKQNGGSKKIVRHSVNSTKIVHCCYHKCKRPNNDVVTS